MSCLEHFVDRPSFTREDPTTKAQEEAQAKAKADAEAEAQAQRIHFAKHYGEDFHGAIGDFFSLSRPEQDAFLQAFTRECGTTAAAKVAKVLRDAAGLAA